MAEFAQNVAARTSVRVFLTSEEAAGAFERLFLSARAELRMAMDLLDPEMPLHTAEGRTTGATWGDLVIATLRRGVSLQLIMPDPDPVLAPEAHRAAWTAFRLLLARARQAGLAERLDLRVTAHPARASLFARLVGRAERRRRAAKTLAALNARTPDARAAELLDMPGFARLLTKGDGSLRFGRRALLPAVNAARHHQQLVVADGRVMILGGFDPAPAAGSYGLRIQKEGPAVAEALAHLEHVLAVTAGAAEPLSQRRFLRTLSRPARRLRPTGAEPLRWEIATAHLALAQRARELIYVETRAFTDAALARAFAGAGQMRSGLGMILLLPEAPTNDPAQTAALRILAAAFGPRLFVGRMVGARGREDTSQRLTLFDRRAAVITSADLTPAALARDTETGLYLRNGRDVAELSQRVMDHWLRPGRAARPGTPTDAVALWRRMAEEDAALPPGERATRVLPYPMPA